MLNWLKFFPAILTYRNKSEYPNIKIDGPYFKTMWSHSLVLNGCTLKFKAPWQSFSWEPRYGFRMAGGRCSKDFRNTDSLVDYFRDCKPESRWKYSPHVSKEWLFTSEWFGENRADLTMKVMHIGLNDRNYSNRPKADELPDYKGLTFFHPRIFEAALTDFLKSRLGHKRGNMGVGEPFSRVTPLNWTPIKLSYDLPAVQFDFYDYIDQIPREDEPYCLSRYIAFPIAHNRIELICFEPSELNTSQYFQQPVDLMNKIIPTIQLEISKEIQDILKGLKGEGVDLALSKEFAPIKWDYDEEVQERYNYLEALESEQQAKSQAQLSNAS